MISIKQKIGLCILLITTILLAILCVVICTDKGTNGNTISFEGEKYTVWLNEYTESMLSKQKVEVRIKRESDDKIIDFIALFDNGGKEYKKDNFDISFEDTYLSIDLINNSGILCGSYQFYYDQLDKIK